MTLTCGHNFISVLFFTKYIDYGINISIYIRTWLELDIGPGILNVIFSYTID